MTGTQLTTPNQSYVYFLVRQDGKRATVDGGGAGLRLRRGGIRVNHNIDVHIDRFWHQALEVVTTKIPTTGNR